MVDMVEELVEVVGLVAGEANVPRALAGGYGGGGGGGCITTTLSAGKWWKYRPCVSR